MCIHPVLRAPPPEFRSFLSRPTISRLVDVPHAELRPLKRAAGWATSCKALGSWEDLSIDVSIFLGSVDQCLIRTSRG